MSNECEICYCSVPVWVTKCERCQRRIASDELKEGDLVVVIGSKGPEVCEVRGGPADFHAVTSNRLVNLRPEYENRIWWRWPKEAAGLEPCDDVSGISALWFDRQDSFAVAFFHCGAAWQHICYLRPVKEPTPELPEWVTAQGLVRADGWDDAGGPVEGLSTRWNLAPTRRSIVQSSRSAEESPRFVCWLKAKGAK